MQHRSANPVPSVTRTWKGKGRQQSRWPGITLLPWVAAALLALIQGAALAAPQFPALTGRVVDEAGILSPQAETELGNQLAEHERATTNQVVVVTLKSLHGYDIADYGYQLGRHWGIGQKGKNNGVLLIVAPNERKMRIEVGYGLEGTITDALSRDIIERVIKPPFRQGNYEQGIRAGTTAILAALAGEYRPAAPPVTAIGEGASLSSLVFLFILAPLLASFARVRPGKRPSGGTRLWTATVFGGAASAVVWFVSHLLVVAIVVGAVVFVLALLSRGQLGGGHYGGGWASGGGWSGGDSGGFSGGGGSFGGGGASGDW